MPFPFSSLPIFSFTYLLLILNTRPAGLCADAAEVPGAENNTCLPLRLYLSSVVCPNISCPCASLAHPASLAVGVPASLLDLLPSSELPRLIPVPGNATGNCSALSQPSRLRRFSTCQSYTLGASLADGNGMRFRELTCMRLCDYVVQRYLCKCFR